MTRRFIYTDKVGAGPEHPNKQWGLFSKELAPAEAEARYTLNAVNRSDWFGIVLMEPGDTRPRSYLQMCPRANGVVLQKLGPSGSIDASYTWSAYFDPANPQPYAGDRDRIFLDGIVWYAYPDDEKFYARMDSLGHIDMEFRADGYAKQDRVISHGFNQPSEVETREFRDVDVSANWFQIPEFGDWDALFHPDPS